MRPTIKHWLFAFVACALAWTEHASAQAYIPPNAPGSVPLSALAPQNPGTIVGTTCTTGTCSPSAITLGTGLSITGTTINATGASTVPASGVQAGTLGSGVLLSTASIQTVEQLTIATNSTTSNSLNLSGSATGGDSNQGSQIQFSNTTAGTMYYIRENAGGALDFLNGTYSNAFSLPSGATPVIANNGYSATNTTGYSLTNTSGSITSGTTGFGENFVGTVNDSSAVDGVISYASVTCTACAANTYLVDWKNNGTSLLRIDQYGDLFANAAIQTAPTAAFAWNGRGLLTSPAANAVQMGNTNASSPSNQTLSTQGALAGTALNTAGGNLTIQSGLGTGTGTPSTISLQVPASTGSSSTSQQTAYTELSLSPTAITIGETTNKPTITYASAVVSGGATFTLGTGTGACATTSTLTGGVQAGSFKCTGTLGVSTQPIVLPTAPHGWACSASDVTSGTVWAQSATSTTGCTVNGTIATSGDVVVFQATGY